MWTFACAGFFGWNGEGGSAGRTNRSGSASGNATQLQWPQLSVLPSSHSGVCPADQSTRMVRIECFLIGAGEQCRVTHIHTHIRTHRHTHTHARTLTHTHTQNLHFANNRYTAGQFFCMRCVGLAKKESCRCTLYKSRFAAEMWLYF